MRVFFPLLIIFFVSISAFSQQAKDTLTIPEKFDNIYRTSGSYEDYKVIRKTRYQDLKQQVSDSLNALKTELESKGKLVISKNDSIADLKKIASVFEADLNQTIAQKNSVQLIGFEVSKSLYNIIVWSLIALLLILLLYFIYKFKKSHIVTYKAKNNLHELEEEFNLHKKKSLEREQKLRRELQDEINKQRGVSF